MALAASVLTGCGFAVVVERRGSLAAALADLPWATAALATVLPVLTVAHYGCAALALRAASGRPLSLADTTRAQLSAAVANRLIPNGLAGNAVNVRYLQRCGSEGGAAVSTLAALCLIGSLVDAGYAAAVSALGPFAGVEGASAEFQRLAGHGASAGGRFPLLWLAVAGVVLAFLVRRYGAPNRAAIARGVRRGARHFVGLAVARRRILAAAAASAGTTAALSLGFIVTAETIGVTSTPAPIGALVALYLLAAAAGGSAPLPPFCGATEAALVGALIFTGYTPASSLAVVLVFRLTTYWLPVPFGVIAARRLRTRGLL